jgi:hypothetical protein
VRHRIGRRRFDRIVFGLAIVGVLAVLAYMGACDEDTPTIPDPVVTQPTPPTPVSPAPVPTEVTPSPTPKPELPIWVSCNAGTGICTFGTSDGGTYAVYAKCTEPAGHAAVHGEWRSDVVDGDKVDVRDVCHKIEPYDCKPRSVPVQVDFQAKHRHIGHLGPLYHLKFPQKLSPEECEECVEWPKPKVSTECAEWNECHPHPSANHFSASNGNGCFQERLCVETSEWNCKDPDIREFEETQPCECECETEWGPWEIIDVDSEETPCEEVVTFSTGNHEPVCKQTITTTTTWERVEKCTQETEQRVSVETETVDCDCPPEGEGCHISNQGQPGETNFNVVLTKANAHSSHTQATHCPGDIFPPNDCTCVQAKAQAAQCGDPAAGGFVCKSNR